MQIKHTQPSRLFFATGGGAGVNPDFPCGHGNPALSLHLLSTHNGVKDDIGILLPVCMAPGLFGAALAFVHASTGAAAAEEFVTGMLASRDQALAHIRSAAAQQERAYRHCCQAGFLTQGREHTSNCRPATPTS